MSQPLSDHVALVVGGARGAGRAIAEELGDAGAIVYVTGGAVASPNLIDVAVDHTHPGQVAALVARIAAERDGRLDLVVNDIWGGESPTASDGPFWEHDLRNGLRIQEIGLHTHIVTSWHAVPLLVGHGGEMIVEMVDGAAPEHRGDRLFDLAKVALIRTGMSPDAGLRPHGVAVIAVAPGFLTSDGVLEHLGVVREGWREGANSGPRAVVAGRPHTVGRAIVALATDPYVVAKTGQALSSWTINAA